MRLSTLGIPLHLPPTHDHFASCLYKKYFTPPSLTCHTEIKTYKGTYYADF